MSGSGSRGERDVAATVALAEGAVADRVFIGVEDIDVPRTNVFGQRVALERVGDASTLVGRLAESKARGERVAVVARAAELAAVRGELARVAEARIAVVVHALAEGDASDVGLGSAFALADLPWGMLLGAGAGDALDLALIARRAAEDSNFPFFVVHPSTRDVRLALPGEPMLPTASLYEAFLGGPRPPGTQDVGGARRGAFTERVHFALLSAMRELDALGGRRHDVIERAPRADCSLALVGAGVIGQLMLAEVGRLRASGYDVGAVRVVAWRPFPAARLVKSLSRTLAMTVLEGPAYTASPNGPLATHVKAAFADALTWAPDYPGIGSIPRIISGHIASSREVDSRDAEAMVRNMMRDELGKRTFILGGGPMADLE
jgi:pyruvate-ferredoxin/flavodoxin oxidoreductase